MWDGLVHQLTFAHVAIQQEGCHFAAVMQALNVEYTALVLLPSTDAGSSRCGA